ncbi:MAG: hypothetical protein J6Q65_07230 [Lentisphaeria bacterium]|nr:hypothetical protein [Lentisphaeria bacterium]
MEGVGGGPEPHFFQFEDEFFNIFTGCGTIGFFIAGEIQILRPGKMIGFEDDSTVFHQILNPGDSFIHFFIVPIVIMNDSCVEFHIFETVAAECPFHGFVNEFAERAA